MKRPDKSYFQEPIELKDLIDTNNIIQRFLPKPTDIDKILKLSKGGVERNAFTTDDKRDTGRIFK